MFCTKSSAKQCLRVFNVFFKYFATKHGSMLAVWHGLWISWVVTAAIQFWTWVWTCTLLNLFIDVRFWCSDIPWTCWLCIHPCMWWQAQSLIWYEAMIHFWLFWTHFYRIFRKINLHAFEMAYSFYIHIHLSILNFVWFGPWTKELWQIEMWGAGLGDVMIPGKYIYLNYSS